MVSKDAVRIASGWEVEEIPLEEEEMVIVG
jgi:hypothetical protein